MTTRPGRGYRQADDYQRQDGNQHQVVSDQRRNGSWPSDESSQFGQGRSDHSDRIQRGGSNRYTPPHQRMAQEHTRNIRTLPDISTEPVVVNKQRAPGADTASPPMDVGSGSFVPRHQTCCQWSTPDCCQPPVNRQCPTCLGKVNRQDGQTVDNTRCSQNVAIAPMPSVVTAVPDVQQQLLSGPALKQALTELLSQTPPANGALN